MNQRESEPSGRDGGPPSTDEFPARGGIDVFDPLLVRQPIREGATGAVHDLVAEWARANAGGDVRSLLPVRDVTFATLFLDRGAYAADTGGDAAADALVWYLELLDDDADRWASPDRTLRAESPLFEAGLADLVAPAGTVHADGRDGHQLITHATHPQRQRRYLDHCGDLLLAPVASGGLPMPVAATTIPLEAGLTSRIVSRAVALGNWLKGFDAVAERARDRTDTLEAEAMYTESLLLEPVDGRLVLHYYMETEDMDRLYEAYRASDGWEVRFSDWVMRRVFVDPDDMLEPPLDSDCDVLVHAVHPDRP